MNPINFDYVIKMLEPFFDDADIPRYLQQRFRPGTLFIWHGTSCKVLVDSLLRHVTPIDTHSFINSPINSFKTSIILVKNYKSEYYIPSSRIKELTNHGLITILCTNTLPIIADADAKTFDSVCVIPFNRFVNQRLPPNAAKDIWDYLRNWDDEIRAPNMVSFMLESLKQLAAASTPNSNSMSTESTRIEGSKIKNELYEILECEKKTVKIHDDLKMPSPPKLCVEYTDDVDMVDTNAPTPSPKYAQITIDMFGNNRSEPSATLTIAVDVTSDGYVATYRETTYTTRLYIAEDRLLDYVRIFFESIEDGSDVYEKYKFITPGFPTTTIAATKIQKYIAANFIQQLSFLTENWPTL